MTAGCYLPLNTLEKSQGKSRGAPHFTTCGLNAVEVNILQLEGACPSPKEEVKKGSIDRTLSTSGPGQPIPAQRLEDVGDAVGGQGDDEGGGGRHERYSSRRKDACAPV